MKVSVITNRGVGIVRSAANRHEKCEIVDAISSTHFENTATELATKAGEWWDGATGTITMVRAGNGSLKVSVSFPATSYAQPLKSIGIRVKAQGDERAHILYAVSDGNTAIALNRPYTCDYEIPINVSSDTIEDVGSEPVPGLEDYYTKSETDTAIGNAITELNLGAASQKGVDTSIGDASSSDLPTSDAVKAYVDAHSGGGGDTSNLGASLYYDSDTKRLELKNTSKEVISGIDATAFIKDGMLDSVTVSGGNLNFVFNTDAGKETISIPLSEFFDASAYYTKSEVDADLENYYTKAEINNKGYCTEAEVNTRLWDYGSSIYYDSKTKRIELINGDSETLSGIDATAFVKDGMVNNVAIVGDYLVITFNTDAGKEAINIPMSSFFDASAYYTKSEVDTNLENYYSKPEINANYYTKTDVDANYYTKTDVDLKLKNYYTKKEVDNKGYCTEAEINANHYTKSEVNAGYYSKSEIDGGYIANASYNSGTNTLTLSSKDGSKQIDLDLS